MKLSELIDDIMNNPNIEDEITYAQNVINTNIKARFDNGVLITKGVMEKTFREVRTKAFGYPRERGIIDKSLVISSPEEDYNIEHKYIFNYRCPNDPYGSIQVPPPRNLSVKKEITSNDVFEILLHIDQIRKQEGLTEYKAFMPHKFAIYVTEFLENPLDALFVTDEMVKHLDLRGESEFGNGRMVRLIGLCFALKAQVKLDYPTAIKILNDTFGGRKSVMALGKQHFNKMKSVYESMFWMTKVLYPFITDGEAFLNELDEFTFVENKYITIGKRGSDVFKYLVAILLQNGTNAWNEVPILTIGQLREYYLKTPIVEGSQKTAIDYLFRNKTHLSSVFKCASPEGTQVYVEDTSDMGSETDSKGRAKQTYHPETFTEIVELFENYRLYLRKRKPSSHEVEVVKKFLSRKPEHITDIKHLTVENVENWCLEFVNYCKDNGLTRKYCRTIIRSSLHSLVNMKEIFGQGKNIIGISYLNFPFEKRFLVGNPGTPEEETVVGRISKKISESLESSDDDQDGPPKTLSDIKGTFKTDIELADEIVRAIYNYKPKGIEGTPEYFHEYQYTTMLRVMADGGSRSEEVINMPHNTLSYLDEHDVNIVILGLSKLGERFGVVPAGKETAKMIQECTKMRKKLFPKSEILMKMKGNKGFSEVKYVRQFITVNPTTGRINGVNPEKLAEHLDKICEEAKVVRPEKTRFHFLRHRAAEYFFFGMSHYGFEHSDDVTYKVSVIKRLLRHLDVEMTHEYLWSDLLNLIAEKNLVFLRDPRSVADLNPEDGSEYKEQKILIESLQARIRKDLEKEFSEPGIHRVQLLLSSPFSMLPDEALEAMNTSQDVSKVIEFLRQVDGEKSEGTVPVSGAFFGRCLKPSCYRQKERITCVSCHDHLIQKRDEPRLIGEIVNCHIRIQEIYMRFEDKYDHKEQLRSLRARISVCTQRLHNELGLAELEIVQKVQKRIHEKGKEMENAEVKLKDFQKKLEKILKSIQV